ncbi:MAP3K12-binding inhibitory protein 1 isoform X2 [Ambystoma mexicanum]|uniref:MAP3K12-binding inhibitory protein 1 isoform X2 n=1 Tax=Ambystoma mexicanum TaxID=8296 RepID=UPI0037E72CB6
MEAEALLGALQALQGWPRQLHIPEDVVNITIDLTKLQDLPAPQASLLGQALQKHIQHMQSFLEKLDVFIKGQEEPAKEENAADAKNAEATGVSKAETCKEASIDPQAETEVKEGSEAALGAASTETCKDVSMQVAEGNVKAELSKDAMGANSGVACAKNEDDLAISQREVCEDGSMEVADEADSGHVCAEGTAARQPKVCQEASTEAANEGDGKIDLGNSAVQAGSAHVSTESIEGAGGGGTEVCEETCMEIGEEHNVKDNLGEHVGADPGEAPAESEDLTKGNGTDACKKATVDQSDDQQDLANVNSRADTMSPHTQGAEAAGGRAGETCSKAPAEDEAPRCSGHEVVQIKAQKAEIDRRIMAFIERKQAEINENNVREFCNVIDCNQVTRVVNTYGPQTRPERAPTASTKAKVLTRECRNQAVEERLQNMETHLRLQTGGPVPKDIYQRIKRLEEKILELEGMSPEYFETVGYSGKRRRTRETQSFSLVELDEKIANLRKKLTRKATELCSRDGAQLRG